VNIGRVAFDARASVWFREAILVTASCSRPTRGLLYASTIEAGETTIRCNVSSWYVDPSYRIYAPLLTSMAHKNKQVTYINISPAAPTWPLIEAMGYRPYCSGQLYSLPALSRAEPGMTIETVAPETRSIAGLPAADMELLARHAQYGCVALVCHTSDGPLPFVMAPKRIRRGRIPLPALQLVFCRDVADFVRCAGAIGRFLIRQGKPVVIVNANGPVTGLAGFYSAARGRKYFKGPHPPRLTDLTETELVLYGS
jgi:hypothetical protein